MPRKARQKIVQYDPLIVHGHNATRFAEQIDARRSGRCKPIDDSVVKLEEGQVRLRHSEIFIVAGIADGCLDQTSGIIAARQIVWVNETFRFIWWTRD